MVKNEDEKVDNEAAEVRRTMQLIKPAHMVVMGRGGGITPLLHDGFTRKQPTPFR